MPDTPRRCRSILLQALWVGLGTIPIQPVPPARAEGVAALVKAFCLTAFESEMTRAGKIPPQGMATFACDCVSDQIVNGNSLDLARNNCRQATADRYPI